MAWLTDLTFRLGHAIRTQPWMQLVVGALLVGAGALAVLVGAGHGRLIGAGALVLVGGATAVRGGHAQAGRNAEHGQPREDGRSSQPELPD
jgi:hypothetical protein